MPFSSDQKKPLNENPLLTKLLPGFNLAGVTWARHCLTLTPETGLTTLGHTEQTCLTMLERTAALETDLQQLSLSLDTRTVDASEALNTEYATNIEYKSVAAYLRLSQSASHSLKKMWDWLSTLVTCVQTHIKVSSEYHSFYNDLNVCDTGMRTLISMVHRSVASRPRQLSNMATVLQELMSTLLSLQDLASDLVERSRSVSPIEERISLQQPRRARLLADYVTDQFSLRKNQLVIVESLASSAQQAKEADIDEDVAEEEGMWRIRVERPQQGGDSFVCVVPSILLLLDAVDTQAVNAALRLRQKFKAGWRDTCEAMRREILRCLSHAIDSKQLAKTDQPTKDDCCALLCIANQLLYSANDTTYDNFSWKRNRLISDFEADEVPNSDDVKVTENWVTVRRIIAHFQDLMEYSNFYREWADSGRSTCHLTIQQSSSSQEFVPENEERYVTNAYIHPIGNGHIKELELSPGSSEMENETVIIEERAPIIKSATFILQSPNNLEDSGVDEVIRADSISESQRYAITGVLDPQRQQLISIFAARDEGIVDEARGVYIDPITKEETPIYAAIDTGLIEATLMDSKRSQQYMETYILAKTDERCDLTGKEIVGVMDTSEEKVVDLKEAKRRDIVDRDCFVFNNTVIGEVMPLSRALKDDLVFVRPRSASAFEPEINLDMIGKLKASKVGHPLREALANSLIKTDPLMFRAKPSAPLRGLPESVLNGTVDREKAFDLLNLLLESDAQHKKVKNLGEIFTSRAQLEAACGQLESRGEDPRSAYLYNPVLGTVVSCAKALEMTPEKSKTFLMTKMPSEELKTRLRQLEEMRKRGVDVDVKGVIDPSKHDIVDRRFKDNDKEIADATEKDMLPLSTGMLRGFISLTPCRYTRRPFFPQAEGFSNSLCGSLTRKCLSHAAADALTKGAEILSVNAVMDALGVPRPTAETLPKVLADRADDLPSRDCILLLDISGMEAEPDVTTSDQPASPGSPPISGLLNGNSTPTFAAVDTLIHLNDPRLRLANPQKKGGARVSVFLNNSGTSRCPLPFASVCSLTPVTRAAAEAEKHQPDGFAIVLRSAFLPDWLQSDHLPIAIAVQADLIKVDFDVLYLPSAPSLARLDSQECIWTPVQLRVALDRGWVNMENNVRLKSPAGPNPAIYSGDNDVVRLLRDMQTALGWIMDVEKRLIEEGKLERSTTNVKARMESHKTMNEKTVVERDQIDALLNRAKKYLDSSRQKAEGGHQPGYRLQHAKLDQVTTDLESRFNKIYTEFKNRLKGLHSVAHILGDFETVVEGYSDFVKDACDILDQINDVSPGLANGDPSKVNGVVEEAPIEETLQKLEKEVTNRDADVFRVARLGNRLEENVTDYETGLNKYRKDFGIAPINGPMDVVDAPKPSGNIKTFVDVVHAVQDKQRELKSRLGRAASIAADKSLLNKQVESLKSELDDLEKQLKDLEEAAKKETDPDKLQELMDAVDDLMDKQAALKEDLANFEKQLNDGQSDDIKDKAENMQKRLDDDLAKAKALKDRLADDAQKRRGEKDQADKLKSELDDLEKQLKDLEEAAKKETDPDKLQELLAAVDDLMDKQAALKDDLVNLEKKLDDGKPNDNKDDVKDMQKRLDDDLAKAKALKDSLADDAQKRRGKKDQADKLKSELDDLEKQLKDLEEAAKKETDPDKLQELLAAVDDLMDKQAALKNDLANLEKQLDDGKPDDIKVDVEDMQKRLDDDLAKAKALKDSLADDAQKRRGEKDQADKLKSELDDLEKQLKDLEEAAKKETDPDKLQELLAAVDDLMDKQAALKDDLANLEKQLDDGKPNDTKDNVEDMQKRLDDDLAKAKALKDRLADSKDRRCKADEADKLKSELDDLQKQLKDLEEAAKKETDPDKLQELLAAVDDLMDKQAALKDDLANLEKQLDDGKPDDIKVDVEDMQKRLDDDLAKAKALKDSLADDAQKRRGEKDQADKLKSELDDLEKQLKDLEEAAKKETDPDKLQELLDAVDDLMDKQAALKDDLANLEKQLDDGKPNDTKDNVEDMQKRLDDDLAKAKALKDRLADSKDRRCKADEADKLKSELDDLEKQLKDLEEAAKKETDPDKLQELLDAVDDLMDKQAALKDDLANLEKQLDDGKSDDIKDDVEDMQKRLDDDLAKAKALKDSLADSKDHRRKVDEADKLKSELDDLENQLKDLEEAGKKETDPDKLQELLAAVEDLMDKQAALKDDLANLEKQLNDGKSDDIKGDVEDMQKRLDDDMAKAEDLRNSLADTHQRRDSANKGLASAKAKLDDLQESLAADSGISLLPERLNEQLETTIQQRRALPSLHERIARVGRELDSSDLANDASEVQKALDARQARLEATRDALGSVLGKLDNVNQWVADAKKKMEKSGTPVSQATAAALVKEREKMTPLVNETVEEARKLLDMEDAVDKDALRANVNRVQRAWLDFGVDLAVSALDRCAVSLGDIDGKLAGVEEKLEDREVISSDKELLSGLTRKLENLLADVGKCQTDIEPLTPIVRACSAEVPDGDDRGTVVRQSLDRCVANADELARRIEGELSAVQNILPLVSAYHAKKDRVTARLDELELDLDSLGPPATENPEDLRKQMEEAKKIQEGIVDEGIQLADLEATAADLTKLLTSPDETHTIDDEVANLQAKHQSLCSAAAGALDGLENALKDAGPCKDVCDALDSHIDGLLGLKQRLTGFDPPGARPEALESQLAETEAILDALGRRRADIELLRAAAGDVGAEEEEEVKERLSKLDDMVNTVKNSAQDRAKFLNDLITSAREFWAEVKQLEEVVEHIQDEVDLLRMDSCDPESVEEKLDALNAQQKQLDIALDHFHNRVEPRGKQLLDKCGNPGRLEVEKVLDDLRDVLDESQEDIREKRMELEDSCALARRYRDRVKKLNEWFPRVEEKLDNLQPNKMEPRSIRLSLEELKVFKLEVFPHMVDIEGLNQEAAELLSQGGMQDEAIVLETVQALNTRWNELINQFSEKERALQEALVRVGELDVAVDEVIGVLQEVESQLNDYDAVDGDSKFVETCLKNLQLLGNGVRNLEPTIDHINGALDELARRTAAGDGKNAQLTDKVAEMNELYEEVKLAINEKLANVQGLLREVKVFSQDIEECIRWLDYFKLSLRHAPPMGARPVTAHRSLEKYMSRYRTLVDREPTVKKMLQNGEKIMSHCTPDRAAALRSCLAVLQRKWKSTHERADKRRVKMEKHLEFVCQFDKELMRVGAWLNNAELQLKRFKNPSKITDTCRQQMDEHADYITQVEAEKESLDNLAFTGTYLKYFGSKEESVSINSTLSDYQLRYKKLIRRAIERGRVLEQAHREDKRFSSSWQEIADWLESNKDEVAKFKEDPQKLKEHLDKMKHLIAQIASKYPQFYITLRLGKNLKERCTKQDPERDILQSMLDELRGKWNSIRNLVFQKKSELDERLLATGRAADAIGALMEWLDKIEDIIRPDKPLMGDLDTLEILMEQHKSIGDELDSHDGLIQYLAERPKDIAGGEKVADQVATLNERWNKVRDMFSQREGKLKEAMKRAEEFHRLVHQFHEWFPQVESELKFKPLPHTENEILRLIDRHERFQATVNSQQPKMESLRDLGAQITANCHPNALRYVRHYMQLSDSRWTQVSLRTQARTQKLANALRAIRGNAAALEELLAWVNKNNSELAEKEKVPVPQELPKLEEAIQVHRILHEELGNAAREIERLTAAGNEVSRMRKVRASMPTIKRDDREEVYGGRCALLQTKYRHTWRMSVDRKKRLQDAYEKQIERRAFDESELESFKKFNFDEWRSRYLAWIKERRLRLTDIFRRQDRDGSGSLTREEFISGIMRSKFPTTKTELNAVFDIFDRSGDGEIEYREFMDALRPERKEPAGAKSGRKKPTKQKTDSEMIADEIEREVSHCQCQHQFRAERVGDAKYRFGDARRLYLVRFLNSCVMVRVGGGWVTLQEFLKTHDPCRAKGRTNSELRERFHLPDGSSQTRAAFASSRSRTGSTSSVSSTASSTARSNPSSNWSRVTSAPLSPGAPGPLVGPHSSVQAPKIPRRRSQHLEVLHGLSRTSSGSTSSLDQPTSQHPKPRSNIPRPPNSGSYQSMRRK